MTNDDYKVIGFAYRNHKFNSHIRGHLIDHQDTIMDSATSDLWSTMDARNYVPEPPDRDWGMGIRRLQVGDLRKTDGMSAYSQYNTYSQEPAVTANGVAVPQYVTFCTYTYNPKHETYKVNGKPFDVSFTEDLKREAGYRVLDYAEENFAADPDALPVVSAYAPDQPDRTLRLFGRNAVKKAANIKDGKVESRFPQKDLFTARVSAGDIEFESADRQFSAGMSAFDRDHKVVSLAYVESSLFSAKKLRGLDKKENPYSSLNIKTAKKFVYFR